MPNSKKKFWRQFLKSRKEIGSVTPSSRFLTKGIIEKIDFSVANVIVELGPGTGVFTFEILQKMSPNCRLIVVELNDEMFDILQKKVVDPRVSLVHGSATDLFEILGAHGIQEADVIVSSLPLSVMPEQIAENILKSSAEVLALNGRYIQFMYSLVLKKKLEYYFSSLKQSYVFLNLPPAFIFDCRKR
jgi:phospholipid N-methyltransferase